MTTSRTTRQAKKRNQKYDLFTMLKPQIPPISSVDTPTIHLEALQEPFLIRTTLSLMYFIQLVEHKLSPSGRLRAWFKLNLLIMLWIGIPCLMILPFLTTCLMALGDITESVGVITYNLLCASVPVLVITAAVVILYRLLMK